MKIAIEASLASAPCPTGLGIYVDSLLSALAENRALTSESTFYLLHSQAEWTGKDYGENFISVSYRFTRSQSASIMLNLNRVLKSLHAELFHATCTVGLPPVLSIPGVVTVHDLFQLTLPEIPFKTRLAMRILFHWTRRNAAFFICNSSFTMRELMKIGIPKQDMKVVPLGSRFPSKNTGRRNPAGRRYFLCVGAIEPRKGQLMLCRAYMKALKKMPDLPELIFAGTDRGDAAELIRLAATEPGIQYLGYVDDAKLVELYCGASLFIFPSLAEGFGIPVVEAMNLGIPVLCSDIPVLREIADGLAIFADPDVHSFQQALLSLPHNLRSHRIPPVFSWKVNAETTMKIYRRILMRHKDE